MKSILKIFVVMALMSLSVFAFANNLNNVEGRSLDAIPVDVNVDGITGTMTWFPPTGEIDPGWLKWCSDANSDGIGMTAGGTYSVASRWDTANVGKYNGMTLTKISFFPSITTTRSTSFVVKVWTGENATNLVAEQNVSPTLGQWNEVVLDTPVTIDGNEELWFGYTVVDQVADEFPVGVDAGPAKVGFGNMICMNGVNWDPISELNPDLDYNWNIKAFVENVERRAIPMVLVEDDFDTEAAKACGEMAKGNLNNSKTTRAVTGYNVYLGDDLVAANISDLSYTFSGLVKDTEYTAGVSALYADGESNIVKKTFIYSGELEIPTDLSVDVVTGVMTWVAPVERSFAGTYNVYLNDSMVAEAISEETYTFENLLVAFEYSACVTAIHTEGESAPVEITFTFDGIEEILPVEDLIVNKFTGKLSWKEPTPSMNYFDDFEAYNVGDYLAEKAGIWTTWSTLPGSKEDALITDAQAASGSNSVNIAGSSDLVLAMGDKKTGTYIYEMQLYIPAGFGGYYNIEHVTKSEWAAEFYFGKDGKGKYQAAYPSKRDFTHPIDAWFSVKNVIDLDAQRCTFVVDGTEVANWDFSLTAMGEAGVCQLGCVNIFAGGLEGQTVDCYFDDVHFYKQLSKNIGRSVTSYDVYLDDAFVENTTYRSFTLKNLVNATKYKAGVVALYDSGEQSTVKEVTFIYGGTSSEEDLVIATELKANYPNPFNPTTTISFSLVNAGDVTLKVFNSKGQLVKTLIDREMVATDHNVVWHGNDDNGNAVSSGIYFYRMQAKGFSSTQKMMLLK